MSTVRVIPAGRSPFDAGIANLTPTSVFVLTDQPFEFRERLVLLMFGHELTAEVVYVSRTPPTGVGLMFEPPPAARAIIEREAQKAATGAAPELPPVPPSFAPQPPPWDPQFGPPPGRFPTDLGPRPSGEFPIPRFGEFPAMRPDLARATGEFGAFPGPPGFSPPTADFPALRHASGEFGLPRPPGSSSELPSPYYRPPELGFGPPITGFGLPMMGPPPGFMPGGFPGPPTFAPPPEVPGLPPPAPRPAEGALAGLPAIDGEHKLRASSALDAYAMCATLLAGRPIVVHGASTPAATLVFEEIELPLALEPIGPGLSSCTAADLAAVRAAAAKVRGAMDAGDVETAEPEPEPPPEQVPTLSANNVVFESFLQFVVQHRTSISQGALVVKSTAIPPGTKRSLRLEIPGVAETPTVSGSVAFQGAGTMGFMLDDFAAMGPKLAEIAARPPPKRAKAEARTEVAAAEPAPAARTIQYRGKIKPAESIAAIYAFEEKRPTSVEACKGWLVRVLDHLFGTRVHGICEISKGTEKLRLWIHDGCVVFAKSEPESEMDKLGRVLVMEKRISRNALQAGLDRAKESNQPLGRTLVGMGELEPGILNMALRTQIMDRVFRAREWDGATLSVGPWSDPDVRTGLVLTSGKAVVANLLREELRRATPEELDAFAEPLLDRGVSVDLEKIDPGHALKKKERRFFEKVATMSVPLRDLPKQVALTVADAYRMFVLGRSLGVMDLGKAFAEKTQAERDKESLGALKDKLAALAEADKFEVLGLHWTCSEAEIPKAYSQRRRELEPHKGSSTPAVRNLAVRMLEMIEEAHKALTNPKTRRELRQQAAPDEERKQVVLNLLDQVQIRLLKDDVSAALEMLKSAQEIYASDRAERLLGDIRDGTYKDEL